MSKLILDNFEQHTPSVMLQRGRDYFDGGCITELKETDDGSWVAEVAGSDDYTVRIRLENRHISDYDCDCPYDGDPCKHTVAVWYALRAKLEDPKRGGRTTKTEKQRLDSLLKETTLEQLQGFVKDYASRDSDFRTDFELYFADKSGVDVQNRYAEVIRNTIRKHSDRGFIDYRASDKLASDIDKIIAAGTDYVNKKNYRDAFLLVKAILLPTVETMGYADDSSAHISGCIHDIIVLLADLVSAPETPRPLLADILDHLLVELTNTEYFGYGDFGWELFATMEDAALKLGETDRFIAFIDRKLDALTGQYDRYDRTQLIRSKISLFEQLGKTQETEKLVSTHLAIYEVRKSVVDECMERGDYAKAKVLIADGILIAEEQRYPGHVSNWEEDLLQIADFEKDIGTVRKLCQKKAFERHGLDTAYYRRWKATYPKETWAGIIEAHIRQVIQQTRQSWQDTTHWKPKHPPLLEELAPVYIEEGFTDRLFELVKQENKLATVLRYQDHLKKDYAAELAVIYPPLLEAHGHKTNSRSEYADLVSKMKRITKDIPAARTAVLGVAQRLKEAYSVKPRRPAMLEELAKLF